MQWTPRLLLRAVLTVICVGIVPFTVSYGQTNKCGTSSDVGCVVPNLFGKSPTIGGQGIVLPNPFHAAHFEDETHFTGNFLPLNTAVATQLTLLPLPSPASGFTYELDRATGLRKPQAETLGPILAERGETLGARRLFAGFSYQRFRFDKIDGTDLDNLPVAFTHEPGVGGATNAGGNFENDVISAVSKVDLKIDQFIFFGSVGITDRFDVSVAVPINDVRLNASSFATINRLSNALCGPPGVPPTAPCHFFDANNPATSTTNSYSNSGKASGVGDVTLRFKQNVHSSSGLSAAVLVDLRLPTGDEQNFLGSGAVGVKPFLALSWKTEQFAPHVNVGYQWNGKSVLAGDLETGTKDKLPKQFFYTIGTELGASHAATVSVDLVAERVFNGTRVVSDTLKSATGAVFPILSFPKEDFNITNGSIGVKYSVADRVLLTANGLISIDKGGLRQRFTPLVGISFLF
jgi:hypothetical protein